MRTGYNDFVLRVSQLPYCPILQLQEVLESAGLRHMKFSEDFYTSIGTAVHLMIQNHMANTERALYGNWKCAKCGIETKDPGFKPECKSQNKSISCTMEYEEIAFKYLNASGHLDTLTCKLNPVKNTKVFEAWEYKTTSSFLFNNPRAAEQYYPNKKHIVQIETYCTLLYILYGIKVAKYHIVYFPREKIESTKEKGDTKFVTESIELGADVKMTWRYGLYSHVFTKNIYEERKSQLLAANVGFETFVKVMREIEETKTVSSSTVQEMVAAKPCKTFDDYVNFLSLHFFKGQCPYFEDGSCFSSQKDLGPASNIMGLAKSISRAKIKLPKPKDEAAADTKISMVPKEPPVAAPLEKVPVEKTVAKQKPKLGSKRLTKLKI